jgi:hypothetical protein
MTMTDDPIGTAIELHEPSRLPMTVDEATEAMAHYQRISHALIDPAKDMQDIGKSKFPKRSAFQKLANAYRVSTEIVSDETDYDDEGRMIRARVRVRATHPDGRYQEGDGRAHILEHGEKKASDPKMEHDCHGTAVTRAKNRAIGDLIAFGAVSAEEAESTVSTGGPAGSAPLPDWAAHMTDASIPLVAQNLTRVLQAAGIVDPAARVAAIGQEIFDMCDGGFPFALARLTKLLADTTEGYIDSFTAVEEAFGDHAKTEVDGDAVDTTNEKEEDA